MIVTLPQKVESPGKTKKTFPARSAGKRSDFDRIEMLSRNDWETSFVRGCPSDQDPPINPCPLWGVRD